MNVLKLFGVATLAAILTFAGASMASANGNRLGTIKLNTIQNGEGTRQNRCITGDIVASGATKGVFTDADCTLTGIASVIATSAGTGIPTTTRMPITTIRGFISAHPGSASTSGIELTCGRSADERSPGPGTVPGPGIRAGRKLAICKQSDVVCDSSGVTGNGLLFAAVGRGTGGYI